GHGGAAMHAHAMASSHRPTMSSFDECLSLVRQAGVHLKSLHDLLKTFRVRGAYNVTADIDPIPLPQGNDAVYLGRAPDGAIVLWAGDALTEKGYVPLSDPMPMPGVPDPRQIVLTGHVVHDPPSQQAGLLIADVANNLRAA